ncbi:MAG: FMN reductase (NADPH) [Paracidovorax wautersii]|uniref:FMN reductase (NADPH) n=1 Tax=Paracidovorax wautersii TaxID=1177982 RepID=A0A7V8JQR0_9BURK|nr:MAG: FMN reductase (NADPH) [Paracidovorax wautersii]
MSSSPTATPPALKVVAVSGSSFAPSRTLVLAQALIDGLQGQLHLQAEVVNLADIARDLGAALGRGELPAHIETQLQAIENADLIIAATPVYRGGLPGHFKHLFDLVGIDALANTPVLLAATGGSDRHALVIDHQLRPLFSFLQSITLPIGVYGATADFDGYDISSAHLQARIQLAVERAVPLFEAHRRAPVAQQLRVA